MGQLCIKFASRLKTMAKFWEQPLNQLSDTEWELLCDGCGKCCLHKLIDDDTDMLYQTNVGCQLLDLDTAQCSNYPERRNFVSDCVKISLDNLDQLYWLPATCAYKLRAQDKPLPSWHHLISADRHEVHAVGASIVGNAVSEQQAGDDLEDYIIAWLQPE